jgi:cytochrome oxidase Cu insertion factor (SCO1/SenC/PrrC family)
VIPVLFVIAIAPVLASYLTYYVFRPAGGHTYGELLEVKPLPAFQMTTLDGKRHDWQPFRGKWVLVMRDGGACNVPCAETLHTMRQYRLAQGKEMQRVERLWLVTDTQRPSAEALAAADGAAVRWVSSGAPWAGDPRGTLYLVDPLGNQVMRYRPGLDHTRVIKEIGRFLKNNEALG